MLSRGHSDSSPGGARRGRVLAVQSLLHACHVPDINRGKPWRLGGESVCDNVTGNRVSKRSQLPPQPRTRDGRLSPKIALGRARASQRKSFADQVLRRSSASQSTLHHDKTRTEGLNEAHVRHWTEGLDEGRHRTRVTQRRDCSVVREPSAAEAQPSAEEAQASADGRRCR